MSLAVLSLSADYTYNNQSGTNSEGVTNPSTTGTREIFRVITLGNDKTTQPLGRFTLFGVEAGLVWKPHKRWSTGLTYDFYRREADLAENTYIQNTLSFQVSYAF